MRADSKGNLLIFNAAAARMLDDATHFRLLFDPERRAIGFQPTHADDLNGFSVGRVSSSANVSAKAFIRRFDIPVATKFAVEREGDLFVAQLPT